METWSTQFEPGEDTTKKAFGVRSITQRQLKFRRRPRADHVSYSSGFFSRLGKNITIQYSKQCLIDALSKPQNDQRQLVRLECDSRRNDDMVLALTYQAQLFTLVAWKRPPDTTLSRRTVFAHQYILIVDCFCSESKKAVNSQ